MFLDRRVDDVFRRIEFLERRIDHLEETTVRLAAHIRARLKEEAEARKAYLTPGTADEI